MSPSIKTEVKAIMCQFLILLSLSEGSSDVLDEGGGPQWLALGCFQKRGLSVWIKSAPTLWWAQIFLLLFFFFFLLWRNTHNLKCTLLATVRYTVQWYEVRSHDYTMTTTPIRIFPPAKLNLCPHPHPLPCFLEATVLLSASETLATSYNRNRPVWALGWLAWRLISLSITSSSFVHAVTPARTSFLFKAA